MIQNPAIQGGGGIEILTGTIFEENASEVSVVYFDGIDVKTIDVGLTREIKAAKNSLITFVSKGAATLTEFTCEGGILAENIEYNIDRATIQIRVILVTDDGFRIGQNM